MAVTAPLDVNVEGEHELTAEIAAEIIIPEEGGWGWVVVAASFLSLFILDGIFFTFGSIFKDVTDNLQVEISLVALVNSVAVALYFMIGPTVAAFINRYGFRRSGMLGSIIISISYFISSFAVHYPVFLLFYGVLSGIGGCFIYMSSQLVVGFYFERLRGLAISLACLGQSIGISVMNCVNAKIIKLAGWRTVTLIHTSLFGTIYFLSMTYRPLLTLAVIPTSDGHRLHEKSSSKVAVRSDTAISNRSVIVLDTVEPHTPTPTERLFATISNSQFPTAADVLVEEGEEEEDDDHGLRAGTSEERHRHLLKFTLRPLRPSQEISSRGLKMYKSILSQTENVQDVVSEIPLVPHEKEYWFTRCCRWEKHVEEARPLYRDDAFYQGTLENLPVYKKAHFDRHHSKTGLEYQMAVTRAVALTDIEERKGVFTTAFRRILATMLDPTLLKRKSFLMVCLTGFLVYVGTLTMFVFLPDRNKEKGIEEWHCDFFVSVIGASGLVSKVVSGILASKLCPVVLYSMGSIMAGLSTMLSTVSYNVYYQYTICALFGTGNAFITTLRSLVLVKLFGLDKLTNATGMLLMFQGLGILLSTPLSGVLIKITGYTVAFIVAGMCMIAGGLVMLNIKRIAAIEHRELKSLRHHKIHKIHRHEPEA